MTPYPKKALLQGLFCFLLLCAPAVSQEIGLLLLHHPESEQQATEVKSFLQELGRFWHTRYGRVKPPPYPIGYYSLADATTVERVAQRFPKLTLEKGPTVAICIFDQNRPTRLLQTFEDFSEPETLVQRITSARRTHLARTRL